MIPPTETALPEAQYIIQDDVLLFFAPGSRRMFILPDPTSAALFRQLPEAVEPAEIDPFVYLA
jgi:hypothetical protein